MLMHGRAGYTPYLVTASQASQAGKTLRLGAGKRRAKAGEQLATWRWYEGMSGMSGPCMGCGPGCGCGPCQGRSMNGLLMSLPPVAVGAAAAVAGSLLGKSILLSAAAGVGIALILG